MALQTRQVVWPRWRDFICIVDVMHLDVTDAKPEEEVILLQWWRLLAIHEITNAGPRIVLILFHHTVFMPVHLC